MPSIHHAVLIGASAEKVYQAITHQDKLSEWWTPNTKAEAKFNSIAHFPFGTEYYKEMLITELSPFDIIRWSCIKGADEWIGTDIMFKLISGSRDSFLQSYPEILGQVEQLDGNKGTLLIFHHNNWKSETLMFAECNYTWGQFLRSLKLLCETGKGKPWPYQHRIK
ncbi:SRPBCC family protein [Chryseobacterium sp. PMSZPI]|uniref:SRPBCC family protein n=1 Tax=Chryseobacterium sp. PMSZPI TaxID=1033900 RepID=UPI0039A02B19